MSKRTRIGGLVRLQQQLMLTRSIYVMCAIVLGSSCVPYGAFLIFNIGQGQYERFPYFQTAVIALCLAALYALVAAIFRTGRLINDPAALSRIRASGALPSFLSFLRPPRE